MLFILTSNLFCVRSMGKPLKGDRRCFASKPVQRVLKGVDGMIGYNHTKNHNL